MADIRPFVCVRPDKEKAERVAALPYDVYNRAEATVEVEREPLSFLAIDRAETSLPDDVDTYDPRVYEHARELYQERLEDGTFIKDDEEAYYIYELIMDGRSQIGIVAVASIDDYMSGVIKKHENTREDKEIDRITHVDTLGAQTGPIFLAYRDEPVIDEIVAKRMKDEPLYDFTAPDGVTHRVWKIGSGVNDLQGDGRGKIAGEATYADASESADVSIIRNAFDKMSAIYIADGHHRAASAVKVGLKRREEARVNGDDSGSESDGTGNSRSGEAQGRDTDERESDHFLAVLFPHEQLRIYDYNRTVADLNGLSEDEFLEKVREKFDIESSDTPVRPDRKGVFGMYMDGQWYRLTAHEDLYPTGMATGADDTSTGGSDAAQGQPSYDVVSALDVSVLQDYLLGPVLGIGDPRTDKRIDFIGGIRGLKELERRADGDMKVSFSMFPTSIEELFAVADAGLLMPPKSTWFEPKLRSGLFIHEI